MALSVALLAVLLVLSHGTRNARSVVLSRVNAVEMEKIKSPHPSLLFTSDEVPELQRKARTSHKAIADTIRVAAEAMKANPKAYLPPTDHTKFTARWNELFGNYLSSLAMYCVLFPEDGDALKLAHEFMEIMASHESWEYSKMFSDEMPISHSLVGMATAYDFLYPTLSIDQRKRFFERIRKTTARHFERFKRVSWGQQHLQNHVWNNNVALLIGAVVTSVHYPSAHKWSRYVIQHLNISMSFHNLIIDGSNGEGVSYSTYTTRSMTMFMNILDRHYPISYENAYNSHWLEQYFRFIYHTCIGYRETVGIGDSHPLWFYGPESTLVFIDRFILHNGHGNWLAARIRESRPPPNELSIFSPAISQKFTTYHTEFLWYDERLGEKDPNPRHTPELALFSDWGVVTYGGGLPPNHTFFSFKSGFVHGRAINSAVRLRSAFPENIDGWSSFNPGHEHPDQGSFTFWPRGYPFITDDYYNTKFSFLNNIIMFAPSPTAKCFPPFEGQIGECYKWLAYKDPDMLKTSADIVAAYQKGGIIYTSGEIHGAYRESLLLKSVYRNLFLLTPDILVIVDHFQLCPDSAVDTANTFFNMRQGALSLEHDAEGHQEAVLRHSDQEFHIAWKTCDSARAVAYVNGYDVAHGENNIRSYQILNISLELQQQLPTRIAYVLYRKSSLAKQIRPVFKKSPLQGVIVEIAIGEESYTLSIATDHTHVRNRVNYLGHTGFATLSRNSGHEVRFGSKENTDPILPTVFVSSMEWSGGELIAGALNKSQDFAVISLAHLRELDSLNSSAIAGTDPCVRRPGDAYTKGKFPKVLRDVFSKTQIQINDIPVIKAAGVLSKTYARLAVHSTDGEMDSFYLDQFPLVDSTKLIYVVRDPRSWVAHVIKSGKSKAIIEKTTQTVERAECPGGLLEPYQKLNTMMLSSPSMNDVEVLSLYWSGHVVGALKSELSSKHLLLVWLEEIVREPETTLEKVFEQFLGVPLPPTSRHYLLQYTRSQVLRLPSGEVLNHKDLEWWRRVLKKEEIETIESIAKQYSGYELAS